MSARAVADELSTSEGKGGDKEREAEAGGGGGDDGGKGDGKGYGGGGDEGGAEGGKGGSNSLPIIGALAAGMSARLAADPNFAFKLGMELLNDFSMITLLHLNEKGLQGYLKNLDFIGTQYLVSLCNDTSLVWLLAPTAAAAAAPKGALGKLAASLPTHIFAKGPFSMQHRVGAYFYKMALYMCIGTCTGTLGTCAVNAASPEQHTAVGKSAFAWAMFMGFSANTRYNIVNGIERVLDTVLGRQQAMLRAVVVGLRLGNNYLGGLTWVVWSRAIDLKPEKKEPAKKACCGGKAVTA